MQLLKCFQANFRFGSLIYTVLKDDFARFMAWTCHVEGSENSFSHALHHDCCASRRYEDKLVLLTRFCTYEHSRDQSYFLLGMTNAVNSSREPSKIEYP